MPFSGLNLIIRVQQFCWNCWDFEDWRNESGSQDSFKLLRPGPPHSRHMLISFNPSLFHICTSSCMHICAPTRVHTHSHAHPPTHTFLSFSSLFITSFLFIFFPSPCLAVLGGGENSPPETSITWKLFSNFAPIVSRYCK